jgi:repressor LexA
MFVNMINYDFIIIGIMTKRNLLMDYTVFEHLLKINNTTVYRVSKETGIAASTFTDWKNGRSCPKAEKLKRIAAFFGISLDELLGTASPHTSSRAKKLPIIGEIRAGSPIITDETLLGYEFADVDDADDYFYLKVCGDSMKDCGIVDGSLVLFRKQQYAENGDIVACLVGGDSATVKRFFKRDRRIILQPENEEYSPIELTPIEFETGEARILGVAQEVKIKL